MTWRKRTFERADRTIYPFIQWVNDGASLDPRNATGGFAQPLEQGRSLGASIPGAICTLHHRGGKETKIVFATQLQIAVLETRFTWIKNKQPILAYEPGARGKLQALSLTPDQNGEIVGPVLLTLTGYTSKYFYTGLNAHRNIVRATTTSTAPAYAFLGLYAAGETRTVGETNQQSPVTYLGYMGDAELFDADSAYVGDDALDALNWKEIDAWKTAWSNETATQASATLEQWTTIIGLLTDIGYLGPGRHRIAITQAGFSPDHLTAAQANQLIDRLQTAIRASAAPPEPPNGI